MKFTYTCKKISLNDSVKAYAEKKVGKLEKFFKEEPEASVTFSVEKKNRCVVEITLRGASGPLFRAVCEDPDGDMRGAIDEAVSQIVAKNVDVDMKAPVQNGNGINFVGVYTAGYIPTGAFFISNNQFNHATGSQNIIKGMRAYLLLPEGSEAKTVTFDISDTPTSIKTATTATPVAIYDLQGNRLSRMAKGVNIIKQANGSVTKVIIK